MSTVDWLCVYAGGWLVTAVLATRDSGHRWPPLEFEDAMAGCLIALIWPLAALVLPVWWIARLVNRRSS